MTKDRGAGDRDWSLFHHRWAIPVMAALAEPGGGAKFVTLQRRLSVSRDSLQRTLGALGRMGLVKRNPGYGHPMRPEYVLTSAGEELAPAAARLMRALDRMGVAGVALNKWSLPVMYALSVVNGRFNLVQAEVGAVTPRALAQTLRELEEAGLVERRLVDDHPPRSEYSLRAPERGLAREVACLLR